MPPPSCSKLLTIPVGLQAALHQVTKSRGYDPDKLNPWIFPSPQYYRKILEDNGFKVERIELEPRLTPLNGPLRDWVRLFCRNSWLKDMADEEAESIVAEVEEMCRVDHQDEQGDWSVMYCRLRFRAVALA